MRACQFGAISVVDGVAVVDRERCTACGACVAACPMGIIQLTPYDCDHEVICSNPLPASEVRDVCSVGCIGCELCVRSCAAGAIHMEGHLAVIDHARCVNCHVCVDRCPRGIIRYLGDRVTVVPSLGQGAEDRAAGRT